MTQLLVDLPPKFGHVLLREAERLRQGQVLAVLGERSGREKAPPPDTPPPPPVRTSATRFISYVSPPPGSALRNHLGAESQIQVSHAQGKCPARCTTTPVSYLKPFFREYPYFTITINGYQKPLGLGSPKNSNCRRQERSYRELGAHFACG